MSEDKEVIRSNIKDQVPASTTAAMDKIQSSVLKTVIEGIPLLTMDNYTHWRRRVYNFLDVVKLKVSLTADKGTLSEEENDFLKAIIVAKLESTVQANVVDSSNEDNARLIWKAIVKFFASNQASNKARVFQSFLRAPYTPNDIPGFITTMKNFQSQLIEVGWNFSDDAIGHMVIHKFPSDMNDIVNQITHSDKEPTIDMVFEHLRVHEHNIEVRTSGSKSNPISLFTEEDKKCRRTAHNPKATGHTEANCWMLHPHLRPAEFQRRGSAKPESSVSSFHTSLSKSPDTFILDSGSSAHMISNPHLFFTLEVKELGCVQTSSVKNQLAIKGIGTVRLKNKHGEILLNNVLYIPDLAVNLLSVRCLILDDYIVQFKKNTFNILKNDEIKMSGIYVGNLPSLEFESLEHSSHLSSSEFLHKSLGHVSYHRLRKKLGIPLKITNDCESCAVSKITKASFKSVHRPASRPFEEIHLDLMGPIWPASHQGHRFILTIVDSCTRFCAAIPIKLKSDVAETIPFLVDIEAKRLGYYPSTIHSDRGSEFLNSSLKEYCISHLIKQRTSDAYIPQQNGLAERFNRTIIESMRTILEDSGIERKYWNEIAKLFKDRSLPLSYFYPLGNRVSFLIQPEQPFSKLKPKGKLGRLIGYTDELRSYRILSDDGKIVETKNVKFLEYSRPESKTSDWDISVEKESENGTPSEEESNLDLRGDEDEVEEVSEDMGPSPNQNNVRVLRERTTLIKPSKYSYLTSDPNSFKNAMKSADSVLWRNAANEELSNIEHHEVWEDKFETPESFLRTLWVFKTKPSTLSAAERKKARLCIQGFSQVEGEDYGDTFAPTGKFTTLLTILMFAIDKKLPIRQFDVKSAFLYAPLKEELYIKTPEGSSRKAPFLRLKKSLYGLKQAPANWYETLTSWFEEINYRQSTSDPCLYIHQDKNSFIFFHVDDLVVVGNVDVFEELFLHRFPNSTAHNPDTLLGMDVTISDDCISLSQEKLIEKGLKLLGLTDCKTVNTPLSVAVQLKPATQAEKDDFSKLGINYRTYTGLLNYLSCRTRPDLAPAVSILSSFNNDPGINHWKEVLHCWKYIKGTRELQLKLRPINDESKSIQHYTDATWADDIETRISRSVEELWNDSLKPTTFHVDNQGLVEKIKNFGSNSKTKHLDIKMKWLRDLKNKNEIVVTLIPSEEMIADTLTKSSNSQSLHRLREKCFLIHYSPS
ncbi:hypothetical protein VP01_66g14 [Puccinia sorghi]|uniref:Integrase catalytic domain-containing protein n=1 Tax=Puccinia sorghi TaxID=27349 RepID=A0A0L6UFM6_9BASI|nr:hypothetical protein VP01_66g14 [Puccinia sorghi]